MKWITVLISVLASFLLTMINPKILAENTFLNEIASHEIVSILVVLLTVTMASIANIHLTLSRLNSELRARGVSVDGEIQSARKELTSNAWSLFGLFCVLLVLLLIKGGVSSLFWLSIVHGGVIVIVVVNLVILYDLYTSVYELTSLDIGARIYPSETGDDGSEIGINSEQKK